MQVLRFAGALAVALVVLDADALASAGTDTTNFAVMRDGTQIGTNSVSVSHNDGSTTVQTVTHVSVGFGFLTLYKFDQTETEEWSGGHLVAMNSKTDDNGTVHRSSAACRDGKMVVHADNQVKEFAPSTIPFNVWNAALVDQNLALDPEDGNLKPVKVIDHGEESVAVQGHARRAHHYQIVTTFPQDVWYDDKNALVQVELKGSDGSTIRYQLM